MLKVCLGFLVSVVGLLSSAYVPQAYATSANIIITQIQAGGVGAATKEFIVIYNNSPDDVDITGWCLTNKSNAQIACFTAGSGKLVFLPAYASALVASTPLSNTLLQGTVSVSYTPISGSSGSITGSSDTITLVDRAGTAVDRQSWTASLTAGMQYERKRVANAQTFQDTDSSSDWSVTLPGVLPADGTYLQTVIIDVCPNIDGVQETIPAGKEFSQTGDCVDHVIVSVVVTELLPNAAGSDTGNEFIELYNPNDVPVSLLAYKLLVGPSGEGRYNFPANSVIPSHSYASFSNSDIPFTLLNSSSRVVITLLDGTVVSESPPYSNPAEGESWALIDDTWVFTNMPTPSQANVVSSEPSPEIELTASGLQPCAPNQYRSVETNRCRLIISSTVALTPCKNGQYRSEETNRCRNLASDVKVITPCAEEEERNPLTNRCRKIVAATSLTTVCKEGQERNPDTNRCRMIVKMPAASYPVTPTPTNNSGAWYVIAAIGGIVLLALGYAIWEWHTEIARLFRKLYRRVRQFARLRK